MIILELDRMGRVQKTILPEEQLLEEFVELSESYFIISLDGDSKEVQILKGGYTSPFHGYLNKHFPGWKRKAA